MSANLYAVCMNAADQALPDNWWIEFYSAIDSDDAEAQALARKRPCAVVCVERVPDDLDFPIEI